MAPALSFTAEEAWEIFAGAEAGKPATKPSSPRPGGSCRNWPTPKPAGQVHAMRTVRADVTKQLEDLRTSGAIGSSLQAE
jgi:isoleucyl-tRNA synthetase